MKSPVLLAAVLGLAGAFPLHAWQSDQGDGTYVNPPLYADYPDPDIIRVGEDFYFVTTTFVNTPGLRLLHSKDLVNWQIVSHVMPRLAGHPAYDMQGEVAYRGGVFAPSLRHHKGVFYVVATPNGRGGRTTIWRATDPRGPWTANELDRAAFDPALFFDDDGQAYIFTSGGWDGTVTLLTLDQKLTQVVGEEQIYFNKGAEGSKVVKRRGYYYLFQAVPGRLALVVSRAKNLRGPWETKPQINDSTGGHQGAIVDLPDGTDYGFVMVDDRHAGRMTNISPIQWVDDWPVWGTKEEPGKVPAKAAKPILGKKITQIPTSDDFSASALGPQWQWNHNPDDSRWSLTERPGWLRLKPTKADEFWLARNTLTQKGQGPWSRGEVTLDLSGLKPGDVCGFGTLGKFSGHIAITCGADGKLRLGMNVIEDGADKGRTTDPRVRDQALNAKLVHLRMDFDFKAGKGLCAYSLDGREWKELGGSFTIGYDWRTGTFQGPQYSIFCYNPNPGAGRVDVDAFRFSDSPRAETAASGPAATAAAIVPATLAKPFPLDAVRLLDGPFADAVASNRQYVLALDVDRLLAPFLREAGLTPRKPSYGNWESGGLDGHTAGHYLSALAFMVASGNDTADGELKRRLDYMLDELERCQKAYGDGYIGGVPGSKEFWAQIAKGDVGQVWKKWVPWYNIHKTYAGLRDAYVVAGEPKARELLVRFGDWCVTLTSGLSDAQMQQMIGQEYGGMNESLADIYAITGDEKYLREAKRFNHRELLDPLLKREDKLTGKHANTQIPKVIGFKRIATLTGDLQTAAAAHFFWETVTRNRNVAFGGNSVAEHFNDPHDFRGMLEHREGPETCNTYNMLRLTEQLFETTPIAAYADYYERALYNHILASIHPTHPGYVYFTPIRPGHYRVYSEPDQSFWCCVGTGMENPGKYGEFIYARGKDGGVYVNLFIPSELKLGEGASLRQETRFPYEARSRLTMTLPKPTTFTLRVRHPGWVEKGNFLLNVNGNAQPGASGSSPSSYVDIRREWRNGDVIDVGLPMETTVERLPDGSNWAAILHGPILLAAPQGAANLVGLRADSARMGHVAHGPLMPLDQATALLTTDAELPAHVVPDPAAGALHFRIKDVAAPAVSEGVPLVPFFTLHDARYQMYWELTTADDIAERREQIAASERAKAAREAVTLDRVAVGEQQPEVEHDFQHEGARSGFHEGRRWREARWFQYTLDSRGRKEVELEVTLWGSDKGQAFDLLVEGERIATVELKGELPGQFIEKRFPIPAAVLAKAKNGRLTVRFEARGRLTGHVFDVRLLRAGGATVSVAAPVVGFAAPGSSAGASVDLEILDQVLIGDEWSEKAHGFSGDGVESGVHRDRIWRHGRSFEYTLAGKGAPSAELAVVYWGGDSGRNFEIQANGRVIANVSLEGEKSGEFIEKRYPIPADILATAKDGKVTIRFRAQQWLAGGIYDLRLVRTRGAAAR